ncbi:MAG: DinB family protein [Sediminibacterium sp.]
MSKPVAGYYPPYFEGYISKIDAESISEIKNKYATALENFYTSLPEAKADFAYAPGKWTLKDLLQHVVDTERIMSYRLLRIARNDATPLASFDENSYAEQAAASNRSFDDIKEEFMAVRKSTNLLLQSIQPTQFDNAGVASGMRITANALVYIIYGHMMHHRSIIEERYLG